MALDSKENLMFLLNYTLCHLLESPHGGDSIGTCMAHCIAKWIVKKIISYTHKLSLFLICASIKLCI